MQKIEGSETGERGSKPLLGNASALFVAISLLLPLTACETPPPTDRPPVRFTEAPKPHGGDKYINWPAPPEVIETKVVQALRDLSVELESRKQTATGITGAAELTLFFPAMQKNLKFKWKPAIPGRLDQDNNSPRREIASYQIQKLFLDDEDYVVPTSFMFCVPARWIRQSGRKVPPLAPRSDCVLGNLSVWLENVTQPDVLFEQARFLDDPTYAYFMANFNLFSYLVAHHDGKPSNYLVSKEEGRPHLFSIDNGVSFRAWPHNIFATNWNVIRVPAFRKESVDRLRMLSREDIEVFGVVYQLDKNDNSLWVSVPPGKNLNPNAGVVITEDTIQFGLTAGEIDDLWQRIQEVIAEVDSGALPVF